MHVVRGHPTTSPRLSVRLPSVVAPLPTSLGEFAALCSPEPSSTLELTAAQVEEFHRDGFLHLRGL